jgi:hypothetical protein
MGTVVKRTFKSHAISSLRWSLPALPVCRPTRLRSATANGTSVASSVMLTGFEKWKKKLRHVLGEEELHL